MNLSHLSRKTALCGAFLAFTSAPAWAQTTLSYLEALPTTTAVSPTDLETRVLRPRNVKSSLLAYWLDGTNHAAPPEIQFSQSAIGSFRNFDRLPRVPGNGNGPLDLKLPQGIESVVPVDPQNALLVRGTKAGLDALEALLPTIDVPLVQYEIETRFLQLERSTLEKLGIKFPLSVNNPGYSFDPYRFGPYRFGSVTSVPSSRDFWMQVDKLAADKKLKVLSAPRLLVIDGLAAWLQHRIDMPVVIDDELSRQKPSSPAPDPMTAPTEQFASMAASEDTAAGVAMVTSEIGVRTILLRRPNDLITLGITPTFGSRTLTVQTTIREEQPFAIQMSPPQDKKQLIVLVKTTRIRRVGE